MNNNNPNQGNNDDDDDRKMPAIGVMPATATTMDAALLLAPPAPPLSSTGAAGTEDDDDDDDWSRRVEMDETVILQGGMSDVDSTFRLMQESGSIVDEPLAPSELLNHAPLSSSEAAAAAAASSCTAQQQAPLVPPPTQPELTMKERLVLRERQRRIETERARLKRQFALSLNPPDEDNDTETTSNGGGDHHHHHHHHHREGGGAHANNIHDLLNHNLENASSVAGTLGEESTMVHPDEETSAAQESNSLGFNMERFLRNSDASTFNPPPQLQLEPATIELNNGSAAAVAATIAEHQGVVMERFLNDPVVVMDGPPTVIDSASSGGGDGGGGGVGGGGMNLMGDVSSALGTSSIRPDDVHRTVSFEAEVHRHHGVATDPTENNNSMAVVDGSSFYGLDTDMSMDANISVQAQTDDDVDAVVLMGDDDVRALPMVGGDGRAGSSVVSDDVGNDDDDRPNIIINHSSEGGDDGEAPRVLRLTEADMQEMAATEEASIANAPPSERDDNLSEVGELADFSSSGPAHVRHGSFSQDTPTTAMESASSMISGRSGDKAASNVSEHTGSILDDASANDDTVAANPPSLKGDAEVAAMPDSHPETPELQDVTRGPVLLDVDHAPVHAGSDASSQDIEISNRRLRPGMLGLIPPPTTTAAISLKDPPPNSVAAAAAATPKASVMFVDDFEYDKDHERPQSPRCPDDVNNDSFRNLPDDVVDNDDVDDVGGHAWSPEGKMHVSPIHTRPRVILPRSVGSIDDHPILPESLNLGLNEGGGGGGYGTIESLSRLSGVTDLPKLGPLPSALRSESEPLLLPSDVPPEIITTRVHSDSHSLRESSRSSHRARLAQLLHPRRVSVASMVDSVFSDVRSEEEFEKEETHNESALYMQSSAFARAMPERLIALTATLCLEFPVLLMISGGSDALCELIGRSRYQLMMGFLPLASAISGNVGLQSSTLTTRAVSHNHVTTNDFMNWLKAEICAACYLGFGMGTILGAVAFFMSGMDFAFGLTIMIAQFASIVTAGCTGTLAPLLFTFILGRDAGKWGGPLETAIQDIVGGFAMVVMSYYILMWLGPHTVAPGDMCGRVLEVQ